MKILAIDQASHAGWAISNDIYGEWDMTTRKDESIGMKLIRFKAKLKEIHEAEKLDLIVYERVAGQYKSSLIHAAKLVAIIESFCEENGIQYKAYSAKEIKSFATQKGNASKAMMIQAAKELYGYNGNNDNVADALAMLNLAKYELGEK